MYDTLHIAMLSITHHSI